MTRTLYTLAYPTLTSVDRETIEAFRHEHDLPFRDVVAVHFMMVFASHDIDESRYVTHIKEIASSCYRVSFHCRYAMLGVDDDNCNGYVFLVPDEGYSAISRLHDRLYTGLLAPSLRLDLPFIPHMTIGTLPDYSAAKALCDRLNSTSLSIAGSLDALTVGTLESNRIIDLAHFELA